MFLLPYRQIEIESPHAPEEIAELLRVKTVQRQPWFRSLARSGFEFTGTVSTNQFRIMPVIQGRNTYQPWLIGRIVPQPGGSKIHLLQTFHPVQIVIISAFFFLPGIIGTRTVGPKALLMAASLFLLFHVVMYFIGFLPEARKAERRIRELIE
jgi:hypothetical protein